ncbi:hypothetical protein [Aeromicrobium alkaliterrae]|uniref:SDR family oxidoreductase n=1 Tax=Aeromicrobium alkaliterrae TaxID=302168 RepID=A0ABN2JLE8_9ACTN
MDLLVLGGTAFLGRAVATEAVARGHRVVCAARGSAPVPDGASLVRLDRDHDRGLAPVVDHSWDAVVDVTRTPRHTERAVRDLTTQHHVLVSTGNVYARFDRPEQSEDAALCAPVDDLDDISDYGRGKVACESLVRAASATSTVVRSGLIGGPGDTSGRSGYYPWRFAHPTGADVLLPAVPDFPVALIDVEDLARWLVLAAERRIDGTFNATGRTTTLAEVVRLAADVAGSDATPRWVDPAELERLGVAAWMGPTSLPLWIDDPAWRWFATMDTVAARTAGLVTRPLADTLARTLAYEERRTEPRLAGLTDPDEIRVRAALDAA